MRAHPPGCRLTETKISAYEREERKPTTANLNAMLKALEHAWKKRGLEFGEAEQRALFHTPTLDAATSNGSANEEEDADRRTAGKILVVGSLSAALAPSAALERITTHGDRTVDTKLIAAHEDIADMLATMHMAVRPSALVGLVARHADVLLRLLVRGTTDAVRKRVDVAVVESCAQAGLLGFFGGAREIARHYFALARTVSDDSGDDTLTGQALVAASSMYSPIPAGGRGGNVRLSVEMLQDATDSLKVATSDVSAWAYRWLGQELAAAGDERGFCQAMETTERLAEQPIYHDGRGFFARYAADLNKKGAARDEGVGYVLLGRPDRAADVLSTVQVEGNPRRQVTVLTEVAGVRILQNEPERACQELSTAIDLALDAGYPMGIERIRGLRARFSAHWAKLPCLVELDGQLRLAIASLQGPQ